MNAQLSPSQPTASGAPGREDSADVVGRRIGAAVLDVLALIVLFVVIGLLFGKTHTGGGNASVNLTGTSAIVYFALVALYYVAFETTTGQTLGKRALDIRVQRLDGEQATLGAVVVRTVLRIVDFLPLFYGLGLIVILATGAKRRQRLGDLAAKTTIRRA
jgi:uncharacterized RDD family membrane protein YckC